MIAAYQRISRADDDLGKDGKDKSNSIENQQLAGLRDALLPKLISGEIDVSGI